MGGPGSLLPSEFTRADFAQVEEATPVAERSELPDPNKIEMSPPEIDISEKLESKLANYLQDEISKATDERYDQISKFSRLRLKYRTKFPEYPKDWPIANSSQITVPIIKLTADTLTSRVYQTVMAATPLASVRTKNPTFDKFVKPYEDFLGMYSEEKLDMEDVLDTCVTETINLGTGVVEVTTLKDKRKVFAYDPLTKKYKQSTILLHDGPKAYHIPIEDFWIRPGQQDIQKAPWCGKELRLNWSIVKDMFFSGELNPKYLKKLYNKVNTASDRNESLQKQDKWDLVEPFDWQEFRIFELCVRFDADGDGLDEELIVYYHLESNTILRKKFNTFRKGRRPWIVFRNKRIPHRFYGEGVAEMLEQLQDEISTIHNQRIDNATIANLQIILVSRLIKGLSPGDRLWTGKIVKVTDVAKDVGTLRLGENYPNTVQNETISRGYARELSGIGEAATGQAQPVSRTTATAQLSLLEELNRRFDKTVKGFRKGIKEVFVHCNDLFSEYGTNGLAEEWMGDKGAEVERVLVDPDTFAAGNVKIHIDSTKSTVNREVEFQSAIAVMNLVVQMGQQMMALAAQFAPQAAGEVAHALVKAIEGPFRKVMEYSDSGNVDEAISVLAVLERILPAPEDLGGMATANAAENAATSGGAGVAAGSGGQPTGGGGAAGAPDLSGLESLLAAAGRGNGNGVRMAQPVGR
jgi:hypothetical protein